MVILFSLLRIIWTQLHVTDISLMVAWLQVERYILHIVEKGTMVNEEVEVNVEDQTEVIRVPQHNDIDASDVMNDFASVSFDVGRYWSRFSCECW